MTLSMAEKQILYTFGCHDWHNTVKRLQTVKELTTDPNTRERMGWLYKKLTEPNAQEGYQTCFYQLRLELEGYMTLLEQSKTTNHTTMKEDNAMKLTKYEKETIINFNEEEQFASIYTHNTSLKRRLTRFAARHSELCRLECVNINGGMTFSMDKSRLSFHMTEPYSEKRLAVVRENGKQNGFRSKEK